LVTKNAWKTPPGARPNRDDIVSFETKNNLWLVIRVGRLS